MKKNKKELKNEAMERNYNYNFISDVKSSCNYDSKDDDIGSKPDLFKKLEKLKWL